MKSFLPRFLLCCVPLLLLGCAVATADEHGTHDHADHRYHHHPSNEIGVSLGYVHLDHEDESAAGVHLHYMRRLEGEGVLEHLGLGFGLETIFADELHLNPMLTLGIYPWRGLSIGISPGIMIAEHDGENETRFSTHVEAMYGFHVGDFELGPVVGFAQAGDDRHLSLGLHLAMGF